MNSYLLYLSLGETSNHELRRFQLRRQIFAIQASDARFSGSCGSQQTSVPNNGSQEFTNENVIAHNGGVNAITIDPFEGRYLLSGGADSTISIWDLEASQADISKLHEPLGTVLRHV
jgi:DNA excision repair protein ERCC-8